MTSLTQRLLSGALMIATSGFAANAQQASAPKAGNVDNPYARTETLPLHGGIVENTPSYKAASTCLDDADAKYGASISATAETGSVVPTEKNGTAHDMYSDTKVLSSSLCVTDENPVTGKIVSHLVYYSSYDTDAASGKVIKHVLYNTSGLPEKSEHEVAPDQASMDRVKKNLRDEAGGATAMLKAPMSVAKANKIFSATRAAANQLQPPFICSNDFGFFNQARSCSTDFVNGIVNRDKNSDDYGQVQNDVSELRKLQLTYKVILGGPSGK